MEKCNKRFLKENKVTNTLTLSKFQNGVKF